MRGVPSKKRRGEILVNANTEHSREQASLLVHKQDEVTTSS